ncbi:MAG: alpha/beta hydrolase fold domain-containing protein [Planctomycetaceae bacterium]|nr:alpha/beta hydrolase fold domain-containing protein [Planctomycetaceae bacterium]MCB9938652.1 alpha/beta hydrolase fold domain-containing protein [Planctomycetaceae bacterium]
MTNAQDDAQARLEATRFIRQHDANRDGKLSRDEFPERVRGLFDRIDSNQDTLVDVDEDTAFRSRRNVNQNRPAAQRPRPNLPDGIVAARDIEYALVDGVSLRLDVYAPKEPVEARPLIVWIHGGGWKNGSKDQCPALRFLERGFVVASVDYRLSDVAIYPAQIQDCKSAIRWLRANAKQFSIDPKRIGVWGSSAGGHLVALLGTSGGDEYLEGTHGNPEQSSSVQAVCDFFGPTDFLQMDAHALPIAPFKHDAPGSPEALVIGGPIQENKEKVAKANPVTYVTADDPPFLIVHGDNDPLVPLHQSQLLFEALRHVKVDVKLHVVEGGSHGFGRAPEVDKLVDEFFETTLRVSTEN